MCDNREEIINNNNVNMIICDFYNDIDENKKMRIISSAKNIQCRYK